MVALWNRADHYIFALWFLLLLFSSPNLGRRRLDVCHTFFTHGVTLQQLAVPAAVRVNAGSLSYRLS